MPRAKPSRSDYCASRHLLRNVENARELRRNSLTAGYFATTARSRRRTPGEDRVALARILALVREALGALFDETEPDTDRARLGRLHAVLLRCELDRHPPESVAAELGLSERQLRRERSAAHEAFSRAFRRLAAGEDCTAVSAGPDLAGLRLVQAVELHATGQSAVALHVFGSVATAAPALRTRIEARCLAAEVELDAGRLCEARGQLSQAAAAFALHLLSFSAAERVAIEEHLEFLEWALRWQHGIGTGVTMRPPALVTDQLAWNDPCESRRALAVRALAAFASQRWDVGDFHRGLETVHLAERILPTLLPSRIKERLAVAYVDAILCDLRDSSERTLAKFLGVESLAEKAGHIRPFLTARAERFGVKTLQPIIRDVVLDDLLETASTTERGSMMRTIGHLACIVTQWHHDHQTARRAAAIAKHHAPLRSTTGLLVRAMWSRRAIAVGHYAEARITAESVRADAAELGNTRLHGSAERDLAQIALEEGELRDARRFIGDALPRLDRFGTGPAQEDAASIARRVGLN
jgi:hypothetical protein